MNIDEIKNLHLICPDCESWFTGREPNYLALTREVAKKDLDADVHRHGYCTNHPEDENLHKLYESIELERLTPYEELEVEMMDRVVRRFSAFTEQLEQEVEDMKI